LINLNRLTKKDNSYFFSNPRKFNLLFSFKPEVVEKVYDFAFGMTFAKEGAHRNHRSGGQRMRKNGEILADAFQGKLTEFGLHRYLKENGISSAEPDVSKWKLGKWDTLDLEVLGKKINVKSVKHFSNLLLLETKDWNNNAEYIPNLTSGNAVYDIFVLTRVNPGCEELMKRLRFYYSNDLEEQQKVILKKEIMKVKWDFDIAGWVEHEDLKHSIIDKYVLPQNAMLNGRMRMDAENYYIQAGDMNRMDQLIMLLSGANNDK